METTENTQGGFIIAKICEMPNKPVNAAGLHPVRYDVIFGGYVLKRVEDGTFAEDNLGLETGKVYLLKWTEIPPKDSEDLEMYGNRVVYSMLKEVTEKLDSPKMMKEWEEWLGLAKEIPMLVPPPKKEDDDAEPKAKKPK